MRRAPLMRERARVRRPTSVTATLSCVALGASLAIAAVVVAPSTSAEPAIPWLPVLEGDVAPRLAFADDGVEVARTFVDDAWSEDDDVFPFRDPDRRYLADYRTTWVDADRVSTQPAVERGWYSEGGAVVAFVSNADLTGGPVFPGGDVYAQGIDDNEVTWIARLTCNAAVESHPAVNPAHDGVAYATNADENGEPGSDFDIVMTQMWADDGIDACGGDLVTTPLATGPGDQLWPSWNDVEMQLVYSSSSDPGAPADLYVVPDPQDNGPGAEPTSYQVTSTAADETQPTVITATRIDESSWTAIAFRTDEFRPDGSLGLVMCADLACADGPFDGAIDLYRDDARARIQGSQPSWLEADFPEGSTSGEFGVMDLAFTSTSGSPDGDVWVAHVTSPDSDPQIQDQGRAVADPLVTEGNPTGLPSWPYPGSDTSGGLLLSQDGDDANVDDVLASDGTDRRVLTSGTRPSPSGVDVPADEDGPAYSPDGRTMVYSVATCDCHPSIEWHGRQLVVAAADGTSPTPLTYPHDLMDLDVDPVWSPDGTRIAFVRYSTATGPWLGYPSLSPGGYQPPVIMVLDLRTMLVEPLLSADPRESQVGNLDPAWSPDGTRIVFTAEAEVHDGAPGPLGVFLADVAARTAIPIGQSRTITCPDATCAPHEEQIALVGRHPSWSPDGRALVVADATLTAKYGGLVHDGRGALSIATLDPEADGGEMVTRIQLLTRPAVLATEVDAGAVDATWRRLTAVSTPAWSPDGARIAFVGADVDGARDVWTVGTDGSGLTRVTDDRTEQRDPAWQAAPDVAAEVSSAASTLTRGDATTVTSTVRPVGGAAPASTLTIHLPTGLTADWSAACGWPTADPDGGGTVVTCAVPPLPAGGSFAVTLDVTASRDGQHVVTATVALAFPDADPDNDTASTTIDVQAPPPQRVDRPRLAFTDDGTAVATESLTRGEEGYGWLGQQGGRITEQASILEPDGYYGSMSVWISSGAWTEGGEENLFPNGDIYVTLANWQGDVRLTCDDSRKSHPVLDPSGEWVAWATDRGGDFDVVVAPITDADPCTQPPEIVVVAGGPGDQTWPTWAGEHGVIVYASNTASGEPSDLWAVSRDGDGGAAQQLTDTPADETQPSAVDVIAWYDGISYVDSIAIAARSDAVRPDGSIVVLQCDSYIVVDGGGCGAPVDPYAADPGARVQGSEPAWSGSATWEEGSDLAFTTTADSPLGSPWTAEVALRDRTANEPNGAAVVQWQERGSSEPLTSRTHPTWLSTWSPYEIPGGDVEWAAQLEVTSNSSQGAIHDVRATDYSQRRTVLDQEVLIEPWEYLWWPDERQPAYSSDGDLLAFSTDVYVESEGEVDAPERVLGVVDWNGVPVMSPLAYETETGARDVDPVFSPDGTRLAFVRYPALAQGEAQTSTAPAGYGPGRVMVVTLATGAVEELLASETEGIGELDPAWSLDGRTIALSRVDGRPAGEPVDLGIHLVDVATRQARQLRVGVGCATTCTGQRPVLGRHPAWSPDSSRLVVADLSVPAASGGGTVVDARGSLAIVRVTGTGAAGTVEAGESIVVLDATSRADARQWGSLVNPAQPAWSPDGERIAFTAQHAGLSASTDIATVRVDGSDVRWATDDPSRQTDPAWQPDGLPTPTPTPTTPTPTPTLPGPPDLGVTIEVTTPVAVTDSALPVLWQGGQSGEVRITVRNHGGSPAPGSALDVVWPAGLVPTASGSSTGACLAASDRCQLGSIAAGAQVVLTAAVAATGPVTPPAPVERSQPAPSVGPVTPPTTTTLTASVTSTPVPPSSVDASVRVDASDDAASSTVELRLAQLRLASSVMRTGTPITVMGYWFPPGQQVSLAWSRGVTSNPGAVTVATNGTFATTVLALNDGLLDDRDLLALTAPSGAPPGWGDARSRVLVVQNTTQAPNFLYRN